MVPPGTIIHFLGNNAPDGYLKCDGTIYNISDYPALADHFETEFGTKNYFGGDGITTFSVPNLQGEFLRCTGTNSHTNQGSGGHVGYHQDGTEVPFVNEWNVSDTKGLMSIEMKRTTADSNGAIASKVDSNIYTSLTNRLFIQTPEYTIDKSQSTPTGSRYAYTSRPTNTSVWYMIKY